MTLDRSLRGGMAAALMLLSTAGTLRGQAPAPAPPRSAPLTNLRYEVAYDSAAAQNRSIAVTMSFDVTGPGPVLLSFPAWTPGSYELGFFARWVSSFSASAGAKPLAWDKLDYDTWRVQPTGARSMTVKFAYLADTLDNAMAWGRPDFLLFNGTNVLPYPEGRGTDFAATVTVKTQPGWIVATGMEPAGQPGTYRESNYHDLVDKPFFVGRMDYDSMEIAGTWTRLATYPVGALTGPARAQLWGQVSKAIPAEAAVFGETPWKSYDIMAIFDSTFNGASALEHTNSHVGIYTTQLIGTPDLASILAHEIFHAWNVKRLRPADMVPYRYDRPEPTPWLWVSEGITDYYADLALVRGGITTPEQFMKGTAEHMADVANAPPTALEDASLSTWIHPTDGTQYLYYPKGALAGFMLDILIRDASDNRRSLDDVMRGLYRATYKQGRGFTATDWWKAVSAAAGGKSFADFNTRYVDGREPYPWNQVLPLAGMRQVTDTIREPRLGIAAGGDSGRAVVVKQLEPNSAAADAGVQVGDELLALGDVQVTNSDFGPAYRKRYANSDGQALPIRVRRGTDTLTLNAKVRLVTRMENRLVADPTPSDKARRIQQGILTGKTGS
jgi:predicted metalloprotease with PDZ domain